MGHMCFASPLMVFENSANRWCRRVPMGKKGITFVMKRLVEIVLNEL